MSRRFASTIAVLSLVALIIFGAWQLMKAPQPLSALDEFAQCLANEKATMYGADWCPHCQNEKRAFGSSFQYVPYVECPKETQRCIALGIQGYPTWIFSDGRRFEGEMGLERLAVESGCALPSTQ